MTHLITYLNDMHDHQLRRDFFECLRNNAVMIGPYQGDIILPLLMQVRLPPMCTHIIIVVMRNIYPLVC